MINYKREGIRTLTEFSNEQPKMTLGEILYSIIREANSGIKDIKELKNINDEDLYSLIEKTKEFERPE